MRYKGIDMKKLAAFALIILMVGASACTPDTSAEVADQVQSTLTAVFLAQPTSTNTLAPTPTEIPTNTPLPPTNTALPPPTEPAVLEPIASEPPKESCLRLIGPENAISIPTLDKQTFEWEPHPEAVKYRLEFTPPLYHAAQAFETDQTSLYRWMNTLPWAGEYSWQVSALDANGQVICTSHAKTFTKSAFRPTKTPNQGGGKEVPRTPSALFTPCPTD